MNIFLTGGTGFVGQNLAKVLVEQGHNVCCLIRNSKKRSVLPPEVKVCLGDITDVDSYKNQLCGIDIVLHTAAQLGHYTVTEQEYLDINYHATVNLLNAAVENQVKQFIFISAGFVVGYGKNATENAPYNASQGYAETKALAEQAILEQAKEKIAYTIIRPGYIYGPGDSRRVSLYKTVKRKRFILTTSGKAEMSPVYITDFTNGILLTIDNPKAFGQVFNIAGFNCTVKEYFETVANVQGVRLITLNVGYGFSMFCAKVSSKISMALLKKPGLLMPSRIDFIGKDHSISSEKIKTELGYMPKVHLKEGIIQSIDWAKSNQLM